MTNTFSSAFNFGNPAAEFDTALDETYWDNGDYRSISSADDSRCILVGRTGSGKSATLKYLKKKQEHRAIEIDPGSLSFPFVTNSNAVRQLERMGVNLSPFFQALWKHVLIFELLKHQFSRTRKKTFASFVRGLVSHSRGTSKAQEYLEQYGEGYFWVQTDERIKTIITTLEQKVKAEEALSAKVPPFADAKLASQQERSQSTTVTAEQAARYQQIVDDTQVARLNEIIDLLDRDVLGGGKEGPVYLMIDDLDTEWVDENLRYQLIVCLFQAILQLKRVSTLKILVALRTNIFIQIGKDRGIRAQQEKFDELIIRLRWTEASLRNLMDRRAEVACKKFRVEPAIKLAKMLPGRSAENGEPFRYIVSRTLLRPRDVIAFMNRAVNVAAGKSTISWADIRAAEPSYSRGRLDALRDEFRDNYLDLSDVLDAFKAQPWRMSINEIGHVLDSLWTGRATRRSTPNGPLAAKESLRGLAKLRQSSNIERYGAVVNVLYDLGFLGLAGARARRSVYAFEPSAAEGVENVRVTRYFEVHPTFRVALEMTSPKRARSPARNVPSRRSLTNRPTNDSVAPKPGAVRTSRPVKSAAVEPGRQRPGDQVKAAKTKQPTNLKKPESKS